MMETVIEASDTSAAAHEVLHRVFGYTSFRGHQGDAIVHVADGGDALILMPTGAGKSLCYQIPALVRRQRGLGCGIVVSPLIALMQDQVSALRESGVRAAFLNSTLSSQRAAEVERDFRTGALDLLYVAPERLLTDRPPSLRAGASLLDGFAVVGPLDLGDVHRDRIAGRERLLDALVDRFLARVVLDLLRRLVLDLGSVGGRECEILRLGGHGTSLLDEVTSVARIEAALRRCTCRRLLSARRKAGVATTPAAPACACAGPHRIQSRTIVPRCGRPADSPGRPAAFATCP